MSAAVTQLSSGGVFHFVPLAPVRRVSFLPIGPCGTSFILCDWLMSNVAALRGVGGREPSVHF